MNNHKHSDVLFRLYTLTDNILVGLVRPSNTDNETVIFQLFIHEYNNEHYIIHIDI